MLDHGLALLHISDLAVKCKLFNSLVLPILRYAKPCEVWAVAKAKLSRCKVA